MSILKTIAIARLTGPLAVVASLAACATAPDPECRGDSDCLIDQVCRKDKCVDRGSWEACPGNAVCQPYDLQSCGRCGKQSCSAQCQWEACADEGACAAGTSGSCGNCGSRVCLADCTWGACSGEGVCAVSDTRACACGTQTCTAACAWGACVTTCTARQICSSNTCVACGAMNDPCCAGAACDHPLGCTSGTCRSNCSTTQIQNCAAYGCLCKDEVCAGGFCSP